MNDGSTVNVDAPGKLADPDSRMEVAEPYVDLEIFCPKEYSGTLMDLAQGRRGEVPTLLHYRTPPEQLYSTPLYSTPPTPLHLLFSTYLFSAYSTPPALLSTAT